MERLKFFCLSIVVIALTLANSTSLNAQTKSKSVIAGFISIDAGSFFLSFPTISPPSGYGWEDYEFDDIYGSKNGLAYGGEAGLGLGDIGLFAVLKYKIWNKKGDPVEFGGISFEGSAEWKQDFSAIGARYYFAKQTQTNDECLPFLGLGIARSTVKESMEGLAIYNGESEYVNTSAEVDGTGIYFEAGTDFYLSPSITLRGVFEYTSLKLGTSEYGSRTEVNGGGGLFIGIALNAFFGYQMKSIANNSTK